MTEKSFTAVSLFSGAGGMDVGFENAGVKVVWANELVESAAETFKVNHPDVEMVIGDSDFEGGRCPSTGVASPKRLQ